MTNDAHAVTRLHGALPLAAEPSLLFVAMGLKQKRSQGGRGTNGKPGVAGLNGRGIAVLAVAGPVEIAEFCDTLNHARKTPQHLLDRIAASALFLHAIREQVQAGKCFSGQFRQIIAGIHFNASFIKDRLAAGFKEFFG